MIITIDTPIEGVVNAVVFCKNGKIEKRDQIVSCDCRGERGKTERREKMRTMNKKIYWIVAWMVAGATIAQAETIDIIGTFKAAGGEFADYSSVAHNSASWPDSSVTDGTVSLTASQAGVDNVVSVSRWNKTAYSGAGSEICATQGSGAVSDLSGAIAAKAFISIQLDTGEASSKITNLSLSLWRNGNAAAQNFQLVYDADGNGFDAADALGSVVTLAKADTASFDVSSAISSSTAASHEVRLYYWGPDNTGTGPTHLYKITAEYNIIGVGLYLSIWAD